MFSEPRLVSCDHVYVATNIVCAGALGKFETQNDLMKRLVSLIKDAGSETEK